MDKTIYSAGNDSQFQEPIVDIRQRKTRPVLPEGEISYTYIHGYFRGTALKFSVFCPDKDRYHGRFFQHLSPFPGPDEELAPMDKRGEEDFVAFALTHGACYVESNMASSQIFGSNADPTVIYRSSAAVAEFTRKICRELYGEHRAFGYVFGGSGGGYKAMSCAENTDAFDGAVPFVIGSPVSLPNCLTIWTYAGRMLRNCRDKIVDALEPGGSGDPYAGLTDEEQETLREATLMGIPPRMSYLYGSSDDGSLPVLIPGVKAMDPDYFTDFWEIPGYPGADSNSSARRDWVYLHTRVISCGTAGGCSAQNGIDGRNGTDDAWQKMLSDGSTAWIETEDLPASRYLRGVDIRIESGAAKGSTLRLGSIRNKRLIPGMSFGSDDITSVIAALQPGDELTLDNSDYIAIQTYHRHQIPDDPDFHCFDQYRSRHLPQRSKIISYAFTTGGCGSVQDGNVQCRTIIMNNLMDADFPWQADWYRRKIEQAKGNDWVRLYYNDNAPHGDVSDTDDCLRMVSYLGMLAQALLDVSRWVETGQAPADSTGYRLEDNQVIPADTPEQRGGIQPMVTLTANGNCCARVKPGEPVNFRALVQFPPDAGRFELAEWSFEGEQDYPGRGDTQISDAETICMANHVFTHPGTYFPVVRITANRNPGDAYTRLRNLCRVRVIVSECRESEESPCS